MKKYYQDKTKNKKDECLESESDDEDEYKKLLCKYCEIETSMKYIPEYCNFSCQLCKKHLLALDGYGYQIIEVNSRDGPVLFVTIDMFIYLAEYDFLKLLMEIYQERINISINSKRKRMKIFPINNEFNFEIKNI